jgi:hypothetical protein
VSKSFTALAVMQLVEAGKIDLDAPVQRYLPEFTTADPAAASQITIRHLLNLTSGLSETGFADLALPQPETIEERVTSLRDARPVARPGTGISLLQPQLRRAGPRGGGGKRAAVLRLSGTNIFTPAGDAGYHQRGDSSGRKQKASAWQMVTWWRLACRSVF